MKLKSLRYNHEQKCQGTLEQKPVKTIFKATSKTKATTYCSRSKRTTTRTTTSSKTNTRSITTTTITTY